MDLQKLLHVIDGQEPLQQVFHHALDSLPGDLWFVELRFSESVVCVGVNEDLDTIVLAELVPQVPETIITQEMTAHAPWNKALGLPVLWAWTMRNHQGYEDGLQLEFADREQGFGPTVQMIGLASAILLCNVTRGD